MPPESAPSLPRASRRVADALADRGHPGGIRVLEDSARTAAQAAAALGVEQRQIVKSLVFRGARSGAPVLALVGGTSRVAPALLEAHLGEPVERAEPEWVRERTGFAIGGIPPLGHLEPLRTVADTALVSLGELWAAAGTPHSVFPLRGAELAALTGAEIAEIASPEAVPPQPLGAAIDYAAPARPDRSPMEGRHALLRPIDPDADAAPLHERTRRHPELWTYLPDGPFASEHELRTALSRWAPLEDPLRFTIVDRDAGPVGIAAFMRITPEHGVIEIGNIWFAPALQRTTAATEAIHLLARRAFDELGYRRFEWKCDALNAPSRRAAERFGFTFEGVFRRHMIVKGRNRDTAWFAITDEDWLAVSAGFERWLDPANFDERGIQRSRLADRIAEARHS